VLAVTASIICVVHLTDLRDYLENTAQLKAAIQQRGIWAPLFFIGISAILIIVGMPRLLFCALGGMLFGFVKGLLLSLAATIIGAYGTFLFARWGTREFVTRWVKKDNRISRMLKNPSLLAVFLARQVPVGGIIISLMLGCSKVGHVNFLIGSLLGFIPEAIPATLIGSGAGKSSTLLAFSQIIAAAVIVMVGGYIVVRVISSYR
jgi:uncharacterized membrane protein YdjX (TVP38/TMEM64 family)